MIKILKAYSDSTGKVHATIEECQAAEIAIIIAPEFPNADPETIAKGIVKNAEKILDVLTTKADSRPSARKANGGTKKPRKPKTAPEAAPETPPAEAPAQP